MLDSAALAPPLPRGFQVAPVPALARGPLRSAAGRARIGLQERLTRIDGDRLQGSRCSDGGAYPIPAGKGSVQGLVNLGSGATIPQDFSTALCDPLATMSVVARYPMGRD
jgi:hypothetical protein